MFSFTLKVILHVTENDSKYREVAPLKWLCFAVLAETFSHEVLLLRANKFTGRIFSNTWNKILSLLYGVHTVFIFSYQ